MDRNEAAEKYLQLSTSMQEKCIEGILDRLNLEVGEKVLDFGCGTGNVTAILAEKTGPSGKVVAVDPNSERISIAKKSHVNINIEFINAKIFDLNLENDQFDKVFSNFVFHWLTLDEKIKTAREILLKMKPGGKFGLNISSDVPIIANEIFNQFSKKEKLYLKEIYICETKSKWQEIFNKVGFEIEVFKFFEFEVVTENIESYLHWVDSSFYGKFDFKSTYWKHVDQIKVDEKPNGNVTEKIPTFQVILRKPNNTT